MQGPGCGSRLLVVLVQASRLMHVAVIRYEASRAKQDIASGDLEAGTVQLP